MGGINAPMHVKTMFSADKIVPFHQDMLNFTVEPRFKCLDSSHFTFELDPAHPNHNFVLSNLTVDIFGFKVDLTEQALSSLMYVLSRNYTAPDVLMELFRTLCPHETEELVV